MRYSTSSPASVPQVTSTGALIHPTKVLNSLKNEDIRGHEAQAFV